MSSPDTYSYSKIDSYVQCPFKYKLKYIDGYYFHCDSISTEVGTAIHSCEEQIAKMIQAGQDIDYIKLKNALILKMTELKNKYPQEFDEPDKSNRTFSDKIYFYLEKGIYNLEAFMKANPNLEIVGVEQEFKVPYKSGQTFNGFIDRVFHNKATDTYLIQDIKTYAVEIEQDKLVTPLQFVIYTLAVKDLYGCSEDKISCQYYLPFCDLTQDAGTSGYIGRGTNKIDKIFTNILAEDFTPIATPLCNYCDFCSTNPNASEESKYLCPYFSHWDRKTRNRADIKKVENQWQGLENHQAIMESYLKKVKEVK